MSPVTAQSLREGPNDSRLRTTTLDKEKKKLKTQAKLTPAGAWGEPAGWPAGPPASKAKLSVDDSNGVEQPHCRQLRPLALLLTEALYYLTGKVQGKPFRLVIGMPC